MKTSLTDILNNFTHDRLLTFVSRILFKELRGNTRYGHKPSVNRQGYMYELTKAIRTIIFFTTVIRYLSLVIFYSRVSQ